MSTLTQVVLGSLPVFTAGVLLSVFLKGKRIAWIASTAGLIIFGIVSIALIPGYLDDYSQPSQGMATVSAARPVSASEAVQLAYHIADQGGFDVARDFLASARASCKYDDEFALCEARLNKLMGNDALADVLYQKAGVAPEADPVIEDFARGGADLRRVASAVAFAQQAYEEYLSGRPLDENASDTALRQLNRAESGQGLFAIPFVSESRLKLQVLLGDYRGIASSLTNFSGPNELIITSELLIKGYIHKNDFSANFISPAEIDCYRIILEKLQEASLSSWANESRSERDMMKAAISSYKNIISNPATGKMETMLLAYAKDPNTTEVSKCYMQLAKLKSYLGDDIKTEEYINSAIETAGISADSAYTSPMYEIIGIITDKESPEKLKDVAFYVNEVLENSLPLKLREGFIIESGGDYDSPGGPGSAMAPPERDPYLDPDDPAFGNQSFDDAFSQAFAETAIKTRARVNIANIDAGYFPDIAATITLAGDISGTPEELRGMLEVYDCDVRIEDFSIEKIEFRQANILLVCDTSGSMSEQSGDVTKIERLRQAVMEFIGSREPGEEIGLLEFSDVMGVHLPIGTDPDSLIYTAANFIASGGTDISGALEVALGDFSYKTDELNIILLLSDGQDNDPISENDAYSRIAVPAAQKNTIIYSLGLGDDVDAAYMQMFSDFTGGKYVYAENAGSIGSLFSFLRDLALNQYRIYYTAEDTLSAGSRPLTVSLADESFTYDTKYYTLDGSTPETPDGSSQKIVFADGKVIYGFDPRKVYQGSADYRVTLSGAGFAASDSVQVTLKSTNRGGISFTSGIKTEFVNENTYSVTIPSGVFPGSYDVYVNINSKTGILPGGFHVIVPGSEKTTDFGPYKFISLNKTIGQDGSISLSGDVVMNGWLNFRGDVVLRPESDHTATLFDYRGGFVTYDPSTAEGALASWLADKRVAVPVLPLGELPLYNDRVHSPSDDSYETAKIALPILNFSQIGISSPSVEIYPDRLVFESRGFELKGLASQMKTALKTDIAKKNDELFCFFLDTDFGGTLSNTKAGVKIDLELSSGANQTFLPVSLGKTPLNIAPSGHLKIDTFAGDYSVKLACKFAQWKLLDSNHAGFGFEMSWKNSAFDSVKIYADVEVTASISGVNVTFSDFMLGAEGLSQTLNPLDWTFLGATNIAMGKASTYIPGLPNPFGDAAIAELSDTTLELKLRQVHILLKTNVKMIGLEVGKAEIELGMGIKYSNLLLGMTDEESWGMRAELSAAVNFNVVNVSIDVGGAVELSVLNTFIGLSVDGHLKADINLWIVRPRIDLDGRLTVGIIPQRNGALQFVLAGRGSRNSSNNFELKWANGRGGGY